jgi:hypothetical protein
LAQDQDAGPMGNTNRSGRKATGSNFAIVAQIRTYLASKETRPLPVRPNVRILIAASVTAALP